jgi:hypothetical protein
MGGEEDNEDTDSLLDDEYAALAARKGRRPLTQRVKLEEEMRWMAQWDKLSGRYFFEDRENPGKPSWEPPEMWADAFETLPEIAQLLRTSPEEHKAAVTVVRFLKHVIFKKEMARSLRRGHTLRAAQQKAAAERAAATGDGPGGLKSALQRRREHQEHTQSKKFQKHLDPQTGRFYYLLQPDSQHPKLESTWDKPHKPTPLQPPPRERAAGLAIEAAIRRQQKELQRQERAVLQRIRMREYEKSVKAERRRMGAAEVSFKYQYQYHYHRWNYLRVFLVAGVGHVFVDMT